MQGNRKIMNHLNLLLDEDQPFIKKERVHSEICDNWQHKKLLKQIEKRAAAEIKQAEKLFARSDCAGGREAHRQHLLETMLDRMKIKPTGDDNSLIEQE
jgi:bacterioferritin (cytochrome b1)